jgi:DNA-binding response OmpR family regulator
MKICIIEDEIKLASALKKGLEQLGYPVDYFNDGVIGERHLVHHIQDYDILILDLLLPGKDGFAICQNLRSKNIYLPILVLTARSSIKDKVMLLDLGADDYLTKPFSFNELLARIRALMRRPKESLPAKIQVKDLTIDPANRKSYYKSIEIQLTLKEFMILEFLVNHRNQIVTRDQLARNLWNDDSDVFSNVIDVHIKNLRKKLSACTSEDLLETIRGTGYKLRT